MSSTYIAILTNLLVTVLPLIGITIGTEAITTTVQTLVAVITGLWVLKERFSRGDVNVVGSYK